MFYFELKIRVAYTGIPSPIFRVYIKLHIKENVCREGFVCIKKLNLDSRLSLFMT